MNERKSKKTLLLIVLCNVFFFNADAQDKTILRLASQYSLALKKLENQKVKSSVAFVYQKGKVVSDNIDVLESLNEADYSTLKRKMKGFVVNRDEVVFIEPDVKFFKKLSAKYGTKADFAFFDLMSRLKPDSVWAAYIQQQTDYSGCTMYGKGLLTQLYGKLLIFKKNHPASYAGDIDREIKGILAEFTDSPCACGSRADVLKEYRLFIRQFPKDKNAPIVRKILKSFDKNKEARFNCNSG